MMSSALCSKKTIDDVWPVTGKRFLVRADFNVPIRDGVIENDYGIRLALPTIRRIVEQGGICILMSHLGRPKGVDSDEVDHDLHKRSSLLPNLQENRGKKAYFAGLSGEDKATILSWSSLKEKAASLTSEQGTGKTAIFNKLSDEEKRRLLDRFIQENKEHVFPQLASAAGFEEDCSLKVVAGCLAELLGQHVFFAHDCLHAEQEVMKLRCGEVMLLENVRFYTNENAADERKRQSMAKVLASYGDVYVNDAFGASHRSSATITEIPKIMSQGCAGYLMETEIQYFSKVLHDPPRPMLAIIGGAKVSDKIQLLESLLTRVDTLVLGGGLAFTFLKARGHQIGNSLCQPEEVERAGKLLKAAVEREVRVVLPVDHVCSTSLSVTEKPFTTENEDIPDGYVALDIGPKTLNQLVALIRSAKSAIWNGPLGVFEAPQYSKGTFAVARAMATCTAESGLLSIVGGGDSASAAERCGEARRLSHVSTGGSASLELLKGRVLPGIEALDDREYSAALGKDPWLL